MVSYENVLEQDDINTLVTLRDSMTETQFKVGDIALKYAERARDLGLTKAYMYSAVGEYYGKRARTIRSYSYVAEYYPQSIRESYPILSFDHFKVAMRMKDPIAVLDWAINSLDGRPQTVDSCIKEFGNEINYDGQELDNLLQAIRRYIMDMPPDIKNKVELLLESIERIIRERE